MQTLKTFFKLTLLFSLFLFINSCKKEEKIIQTPLPKPVYNNCKIMGVKVLEVPPVRVSGNSWDSASQPDIFIKIIAEKMVLISTNTMIYSDNTQYPIFWDFPFPVIIGNLKTQYDLYVYDDDYPKLDDIIGYVGFVPAGYKDYPTQLELAYNGTKVQLELQWF